MDIDVTTLTNADLSKLSQRVANERDARIADSLRGASNRPQQINPMAPYDARKRSLEDRVAELERRAGIVS
jgi:hypothetical protein